MKISIRHVVWAPLLIVALALSYTVTESLQGEPCPEERTGWMVGNFIVATFALYFFVGYWIVVTRKYMVMAILTVWAWHLLVLSPFLATTCSEHKSLDKLREVVGFGLREFVIAIALVVIASSFALFFRYRKLNGLPAQSQRTFLRLFVASATAVSIALGAGAYWMVPRLRDAFVSFGADLPVPTLVLLDTYQYWMVFPIACVVGLIWVTAKRQYTDSELRIALNGALGLIILLNVLLSSLLFSAFAPVKTMCRCI